MEGCAGANKKACRQQRCTFSPTTFSSVQFSNQFSPNLSVHIQSSVPVVPVVPVALTTAGISKGLPALPTEFTGRPLYS